MIRKLLIGFILISLIYFVSGKSFGGLIDYERAKRAQQARGSPAGENSIVLPSWMENLPRVQNKVEQSYDVNRDGILQTAEIKTYLRDVLEAVEQKGGFLVDTPLLKEYDQNKDGIVSRLEGRLIADQVRR